MEQQRAGKLYICGTPIGNLEDITLRCLNILRQVDLIAAEDTRHTRILLNHYQIKKPVTSYYEFNKEQKKSYILQCLQSGQEVALVSDAGMPAICDPGYEIINLALENNLQVIPIPGPSALLAALAISGFPVSSFIFEGFIPKKKREKEKFFLNLKKEKRTIVFYDSPQRVMDTLMIIKKVIGERRVVISRELTKKFEEITRGYLSEVIATLSSKDIKGELTLVLEGLREIKNESIAFGSDNKGENEVIEAIKNYLKEGYSNKDIVSLISKEYYIPKNWVYKKILEIRKKEMITF